MLACLLKEHGGVVLENLPPPKVGLGDVLVRLKAAGICGTDLEKIHGGYGPGGILGHEVSGQIEQVGEEVRGFTKGDRVVPHHHVPCYGCHLCQRGDHTMCDSFKKTNFDPCGLAEYFRVPEYNVTRGAVTKLPDSVSFEEAALLEPTACCLRALNVARPHRGDSVLIAGLGPVGLTHIQLLRSIGTGPLFGSDVRKVRLDAAKSMGAQRTFNPAEEDVAKGVKAETGDGADFAIVSTGNPQALSQAVSAVRKGGKVLLFGAPPKGSTLPLAINTFFADQKSIITSYSCTEAEIRATLSLLTLRKIDLRPLITHRFQLKETLEALDFASSSAEAVKTMILV
ncbi:zinc-binding dehydrogenase [Candidatus Bathyarchaeota archaeon]|nr:MAG: zinc-binding dehydrogenase [Candidatus Bathyarchaeota archaeon]TMI33192.1 MAG: zinc-binding dehydrogenase [Candidatus Bathyarchaeota archaeon]